MIKIPKYSLAQQTTYTLLFLFLICSTSLKAANIISYFDQGDYFVDGNINTYSDNEEKANNSSDINWEVFELNSEESPNVSELGSLSKLKTQHRSPSPVPSDHLNYKKVKNLPRENKKYLCFCGKKFSKRCQLFEHKNLKHDNRFSPHLCKKCKKRFSKEDRWSIHVLLCNVYNKKNIPATVDSLTYLKI